MERGGPGATNWRDPSTGRFSGCWVCASLMRNKHRRPARVIASRVLRAESSGAVTTSARGPARQFGPHLHPILPLRHRRLHSPRHRAPPQVPNDLLQSVTYVLGLTVTYLPGRSAGLQGQAALPLVLGSTDNSIRPLQHAIRNCHSEVVGDFQIDNKLTPRDHLERRDCWISSSQDLVYDDWHEGIAIRERCPKGHHPTGG